MNLINQKFRKNPGFSYFAWSSSIMKRKCGKGKTDESFWCSPSPHCLPRFFENGLSFEPFEDEDMLVFARFGKQSFAYGRYVLIFILVDIWMRCKCILTGHDFTAIGCSGSNVPRPNGTSMRASTNFQGNILSLNFSGSLLLDMWKRLYQISTVPLKYFWSLEGAKFSEPCNVPSLSKKLRCTGSQSPIIVGKITYWRWLNISRRIPDIKGLWLVHLPDSFA